MLLGASRARAVFEKNPFMKFLLCCITCTL
jgi:hypothetical protein